MNFRQLDLNLLRVLAAIHRTGSVTAAGKALALSQPLHFGDYGGLPLKVLWALLDIITIIVLGSGLYLWIARRRQTDARIAMLAAKADELAAAGSVDADRGARS